MTIYWRDYTNFVRQPMSRLNKFTKLKGAPMSSISSTGSTPTNTSAKYLVLLQSVHDNDIICALSLDACHFRLVHTECLNNSTPADRYACSVPGCDIETGDFVHDAPREELWNERLPSTFGDVVWHYIFQRPSFFDIDDYKTRHHCRVFMAYEDE